MPYKQINELPDGVRNELPVHAQHIYKKAFNSAWIEYRNPKSRLGNINHEEIAHRVAWGAVKHKYQKGSDSNWHLKINAMQ